jgi:hypothetical protein
MIELTKWEKQIMLLSKSHFNLGKDTTIIDALKAIWSNRCGIDVKYVALGSIFGFLIRLLKKIKSLESENQILDLFTRIGQYVYGIGGRDKYDLVEAQILACLGILANVQVITSYSHEVLIDLKAEDKDPSAIIPLRSNRD